MTITLTIYELSVFIAALGLLILIVTLIPAIFQIRRTAAEVEALAIEGRRAMENLNVILRITGEQANGIVDMVEKLKGTGLKAADLADAVVENARGPVLAIVGLLFGIEAFLRVLLSNKEKETTGGAKDDNHD
ncbi:MAG: hypothetical protein HY894_06165 [Deltaproteobacteria bacterium]|nr:hypothetical protein [Deltaproteobacteria bacterium]